MQEPCEHRLGPTGSVWLEGWERQAEPWPLVRQDDDWFGKLVLSICRKEVGRRSDWVALGGRTQRVG